MTSGAGRAGHRRHDVRIAVQPGAGPRRRGIPPLPLLTLINFFNYLDRQVVYGMTPLIGEHVRALASPSSGCWPPSTCWSSPSRRCVSGPIADRIGPRKVIFAGILVWSIATIGSALSTLVLRCCCSSARWSASARAPTARAPTPCCAPPRRPRSAGARSASTTSAWRWAGPAGLALGTLLAPIIGWRDVFWLAGGPSLLLALASAFIAAPDRLPRPTKLPARAYLLSPTYIIALAGGILATFGASALIFWTRWLLIEERHFSVVGGSIFMAVVGLVCGVGGVIAGGYAGDALNRRARGGHALAIGLSMLMAVPFGVACLLVTHKPIFMVLTTISVFLLSVYNGPSAAVVDELGPPQFAATLQAVFMFGIHVLGNAPAPPVVGWLAESRRRSPGAAARRAWPSACRACCS